MDFYLRLCLISAHPVVSVNDVDLLLFEHVYRIFGLLEEEIQCSSFECALDGADLQLSILRDLLHVLF